MKIDYQYTFDPNGVCSPASGSLNQRLQAVVFNSDYESGAIESQGEQLRAIGIVLSNLIVLLHEKKTLNEKDWNKLIGQHKDKNHED